MQRGMLVVMICCQLCKGEEKNKYIFENKLQIEPQHLISGQRFLIGAT